MAPATRGTSTMTPMMSPLALSSWGSCILAPAVQRTKPKKTLMKPKMAIVDLRQFRCQVSQPDRISTSRG